MHNQFSGHHARIVAKFKVGRSRPAGRLTLSLTKTIRSRGLQPLHPAQNLLAQILDQKAVLLAEGMALSTARPLRSPPLPDRTPAQPYPPFGGAHPLGAPQQSIYVYQLLERPAFSSRSQPEGVCPRAVAAEDGWMNVDQPDKLSERSEFLSGRHSSVRRREPCGAGQDGRGNRRFCVLLSPYKRTSAGGTKPAGFGLTDLGESRLVL